MHPLIAVMNDVDLYILLERYNTVSRCSQRATQRSLWYLSTIRFSNLFLAFTIVSLCKANICERHRGGQLGELCKNGMLYLFFFQDPLHKGPTRYYLKHH